MGLLKSANSSRVMLVVYLKKYSKRGMSPMVMMLVRMPLANATANSTPRIGKVMPSNNPTIMAQKPVSVAAMMPARRILPRRRIL